jgi:hypothetical protein
MVNANGERVGAPITPYAFLALLVLFLAAGPAAAGEAEWRTLYEQSDAHFQRGNLEQAELFAREALKEADASLGEGSRSAELSLARAVFMLRLTGKLDEALNLAVRGVNVAGKLHGPDDPQTAIALQNQAEVLFARRSTAPPSNCTAGRSPSSRRSTARKTSRPRPASTTSARCCSRRTSTSTRSAS